MELDQKVSNLKIISDHFGGVKVIERRKIEDDRGFFSRIFCAEELGQAGWAHPIAQINHSYTAKKGSIRGMHFQKPPASEVKLVTCIRGAVYDAVVDVRKKSNYFLKNQTEILSADNRLAFLIPEGFAHGFQALTDDVELVYIHSSPFNSDLEGGLNPLDPLIGIQWPLEVASISLRDRNMNFINEEFEGLELT